jgi:hypothetical protein
VANELISAYKSVVDALKNEATAEGILVGINVREYTPGDVGQADCPLIMYKLQQGEKMVAEYVHKTTQVRFKFQLYLHEDATYSDYFQDETGAYSRGIIWLVERALNAIDAAYWDNDTQLQPPEVEIKEFSLDNSLKCYVLEFIISTPLYERGTL